MSKVRVLALGFVAACAFSALASGSAQAFWLVNGTLLIGSAAVASSTTTHEVGVLSSSTATIECKKLSINGGTISSPDKVLVKSLEFTECKATAPKECKLTGTTIGTLPVEGLVTLDGALAVKAKGKPENAQNLFATFHLENNGAETCAITGKIPVTGSATILSPEGQDNRKIHLVKATEEVAGELELGNAAATISGSALVHLEGEPEWSFM